MMRFLFSFEELPPVDVEQSQFQAALAAHS